MNNAVSILIHNAKEDMIKTINRQKVNPCIMRYIVKEVYDAVCEAANAELAEDLAKRADAGTDGSEVTENGDAEL